MIKGEKPLITFALFAYNQECFIRDAIKGALSQTYSPLEIIISDDCSSDCTFEIIQEEVANYEGPYNIVLNRNKETLGIGGHVNRVMEIVRGELVIAAAGDDISFPERCEKIYQVWRDSKGKAKSIHSFVKNINKKGDEQDILKADHRKREISLRKMVTEGERSCELDGCTHAWAKEVFDVFGSMKTPLNHEDRVIPFRSALLGEVQLIHEPLIAYRRHSKNMSSLPDNADDIGFLILKVANWHTGQISIYQNWLHDLDKMSNLYPDRRAEMENYKTAIQGHIKPIEKEIAIREAEYKQRIIIIAKAFIENTPLRYLVRWSLMYLLPKVYYRYLKWKYY